MTQSAEKGKRLKEPLSVTHPELASEWHPTKNGDLTPAKVVAGSHNNVWWKCPNGPDHEWQAKPSARTRKRGGTGCPFCANQKVSITNCLATTHPELAAEWHPTKNQPLSANDVIAGSHRLAWWKCPKGEGHEWQATLIARSIGGKCQICCSLTNTHPELAKEWH